MGIFLRILTVFSESNSSKPQDDAGCPLVYFTIHEKNSNNIKLL